MHSAVSALSVNDNPLAAANHTSSSGYVCCNSFVREVKRLSHPSSYGQLPLRWQLLKSGNRLGPQPIRSH